MVAPLSWVHKSSEDGEWLHMSRVANKSTDHTENPLTVWNLFFSEQLQIPGKPRSDQLGNATATVNYHVLATRWILSKYWLPDYP